MLPEYGHEPVPLSQRLSPKVTMAEKLEATGGRGSRRLEVAAWATASAERAAVSTLNVILLASMW